MSVITSFKGREWNPAKPVAVYRNLHRGGYSVLQASHVVGHAVDLCLRDVRFVVRRRGYLAFLETQVKNVHAFVIGTVVRAVTWDEFGEGIQGRYNPRIAPAFQWGDPDTGRWFPMTRANGVRLYERGMIVHGAGN